MGVQIFSLIGFAAAQVATPGPANMALLATGARLGLRPALPFVTGVVLGKQLIIWPIGFGVLALTDYAPYLFSVLKWVSAAYIFWLAWRVANMRLDTGSLSDKRPGFRSGLLVHPLNPKAWAMVTTAFTAFAIPGTGILQTTMVIATLFVACQIVLHPLWAYGGARLARSIAGRSQERFLMVALAGLTVASVLYVLFGGTKA